jgi:hypothetical protein
MKVNAIHAPIKVLSNSSTHLEVAMKKVIKPLDRTIQVMLVLMRMTSNMVCDIFVYISFSTL